MFNNTFNENKLASIKNSIEESAHSLNNSLPSIKGTTPPRKSIVETNMNIEF